ncbi:MAG: metal ABC transporter permease [Rickettsiaceae bacterium]|nr:MAG: metal ABC transporter permease [Rickettsiaceae bacterium]
MFVIILTSILIALIFAPLSCLSLWKRYTYFSDGLAHASLLTGSISIVFVLPLIYSGVITAVLFAVIIFRFSSISDSNAVVNLTSNAMLAGALMFASYNSSSININQLLFGDIVSSSKQDLIILFGIAIAAYCFIIFFFKQIILIIISRDIALIRKVKVKTIELLFLLLLAIGILFSIKIVGSLLVTNFLLAPALTARLLANSPKHMIILATFFAVLANIFGLLLAFYSDLPVAPAIVATQSFIYLIVYLLYKNKI